MPRTSAATIEDFAEPFGPCRRTSLFTRPDRTKVPSERESAACTSSWPATRCVRASAS